MAMLQVKRSKLIDDGSVQLRHVTTYTETLNHEKERKNTDNCSSQQYPTELGGRVTAEHQANFDSSFLMVHF